MKRVTRHLNNSKNSITDSALQRAVSKLFGASDNPPAPAFCRQLTQVALISVDTANMEVTSFSQKGIWVQWP